MIVLAGCDGGAVIDAGPRCVATGAGIDRSCPDGCDAIGGRLVDETRACVTETRVVVLCHPRGITVAGNGAIGCFERVDDPGERVLSGMTRVGWDGSADDEFAAQGWAPCPPGRGIDPPPFCE